MWEVDKNYPCVRELPLGEGDSPLPLPPASGPRPQARPPTQTLPRRKGGWCGPTKAASDALEQRLWGASRRDVAPAAVRLAVLAGGCLGSAWVWLGRGCRRVPYQLCGYTWHSQRRLG